MLNISGTLEYSFFLGLFGGKKSKLEMKRETQFLSKKKSGFYLFLNLLWNIKRFHKQVTKYG
jgi:hypothetical protein